MTITSITLPSFLENRVFTNIRSSAFVKCRLFYNELLVSEVTGQQGLDSLFCESSWINGVKPLGIILSPNYATCRLEFEHDDVTAFSLDYDVADIDFKRMDYINGDKNPVRFANGMVGLIPCFSVCGY